MNQEVKARWVEALRSGKYSQGHGRLNTDDEDFCCLGVLCEIALKDGVVTKTRHLVTDEYGFESRTDIGYQAQGDDLLETGVLPESVMRWAGIEEANPWISDPGDGGKTVIADLNDKGVSFPVIADIIDREL